ncbi:gamma-glutamyl-gamma-aminobutyrate hydrolase family protein [Legionella sp. PATHC035]|uniref:gamma-glutamyl-gamma-aminobutyrate hydrolase family protein n=1 Tax=Legionella sp. PATHC035 TaxID=2992040 RepID=UPI002244BCE9|nr:gamma-glutamyl-gamma-aminobutyrate hydrolase family protein [Legionella sp. PATHC035]MCW8408846.1 gamma-glutamyl-gamma-aminobutyrate hydrolase family protein [Legionella sp. PATHC035]
MFQKLSEFLSGIRALNNARSISEEKPKFEYSLDKEKKEQLKQADEKPKVIALYDKSGGTTYCDLTIEYLQKKGLEVVPVTPDEGLNHPVFSGKVNGIYLPGGPNVPVHNPNDPRMRLEGELAELAQKRDIPLLGICRGQQTVGHHHGYKIADIPEDAQEHQPHYEHFETVYNETQDATYNSRVVVGEGSQLYNALHYKLKPKERSNIEYNVTCLHHQHVEESPDNSSLVISGRGKFDSLIESVEKRTGKYYTVGLQHHPEAVISACEEARQEKLREIKEQAFQAQLDVNHFSDPDIAYMMELKYAQRLKDAALLKSRDEKAARAELGFFSKQVKHHYLDDAPTKEQSQDLRDHLFWTSSC